MTLPLWPEELPLAPLAERYQEVLPDTTLRSKVEQGPAKVRQRTTAGMSELSVSYLLSRVQVELLEAFYSETLGGGAVRFAYRHPRRETEVQARFRKPPQLQPRNAQYYLARLELEIFA